MREREKNGDGIFRLQRKLSVAQRNSVLTLLHKIMSERRKEGEESHEVKNKEREKRSGTDKSENTRIKSKNTPVTCSEHRWD